MRCAAFADAQALEAVLGDPRDPDATFGHARCAELDGADAFPDDICRILDDFGVPAHYVPAEFGGALTDYADAVQMLRMVARRDVTVAVAHGKTYLGAVTAWVAGTPDQARRIGEVVRCGVPVSWGLTERDHGSDLLAGEVVATAAPGGYALSGEKWLINNATRGGALCVLARTAPAGGPRGFSVFFLDKRTTAGHRPLPKVRTHGIRGADISGIALDGALVADADRLGREGTGLESVLKGLQLTRTVCCALSLGAADHAVTSATRYALGRTLYGRALAELPTARHTLTTAYADHLLAEAFVMVAARSIQALPREMAVVAAAVKYLVPTRTEASLARLRRLVGARSLLRDAAGPDVFGKLERDHRIVSLFDGNTVVNLTTLVTLFPAVVRAADRGTAPDAALVAATDLGAPLPPPDHTALSLVPRAGASLLQAVPAAAAELAELAAADPDLGAAAAAAAALRDALDEVFAALRATPPAPVAVPTAAFTLAQRLALCLAGAAALLLWLRNHAAATREDTPSTPLWAGAVWLRLALDRVLTGLGAPRPDTGSAPATASAVLHTQITGGLLPSLFDVRLGEAA